jgi:hypothetical protein
MIRVMSPLMTLLVLAIPTVVAAQHYSPERPLGTSASRPPSSKPGSRSGSR